MFNNKILYPVLFLICLYITNCSAKGTAFEDNDCGKNYTGYVQNEKGTIRLISLREGSYVIVPDYDDTQRFQPARLPDAFRKNGLKVIFSGKICSIPENVRLMGTPFMLTHIEVAE